jgi:uncharacterized membrane protein
MTHAGSETALAAHPRVRRHLEARTAISAEPGAACDPGETLGARMADRIAAIGGSWGFLGAFGLVLVVWGGTE